MVFCRPASQFCCGCSVELGVKLVLLYHFVQNAWVVYAATHDIIMIGTTSPNAHKECAIAAFALAGLPLIFLGMCGVWWRVEVHLRVYLVYLALSFCLDSAFIVKEFVLGGGCSNMPGAVAGQGQAAACGMMRAANITIVSLLMGIQLYLLYIVFSLCEDYSEGGSALAFGDLTTSAEIARKKHMMDTHAGFGSHTFGSYGSAHKHERDHEQSGSNDKAASGLGGANRIYGTYHELEFPPPHSSSRV